MPARATLHRLSWPAADLPRSPGFHCCCCCCCCRRLPAGRSPGWASCPAPAAHTNVCIIMHLTAHSRQRSMLGFCMPCADTAQPRMGPGSKGGMCRHTCLLLVGRDGFWRAGLQVLAVEGLPRVGRRAHKLQHGCPRPGSHRPCRHRPCRHRPCRQRRGRCSPLCAWRRRGARRCVGRQQALHQACGSSCQQVVMRQKLHSTCALPLCSLADRHASMHALQLRMHDRRSTFQISRTCLPAAMAAPGPAAAPGPGACAKEV
jgi:hypothetical protein